ncbi:hypothetical protein SUGI_0265910 [Cryptomeria japonica]|nr:hypothetical protein SUGI_0265910 [Cryptomeria japonica]
MNWLREGDRGTKYFFNYIGPIFYEGQVSNDPGFLKSAFMDFFQSLFSSNQGSRNNQAKVSATMEIPKDRFMTLLQERVMLVYKADICSAHFFPQGKNKVNKEELELLNKYLEEKTKITKQEIDKKKEELELLNKYLEEKTKITKQEIDKKNSEKKTPYEIKWNTTVDPDIVPPLGTYECDNADCSNNFIGSWD